MSGRAYLVEAAAGGQGKGAPQLRRTALFLVGRAQSLPATATAPPGFVTAAGVAMRSIDRRSFSHAPRAPSSFSRASARARARDGERGGGGTDDSTRACFVLRSKRVAPPRARGPPRFLLGGA